MNIILVGFMGTGKTSVARILSKMMKWPRLDVDDEITRIAGKSIPAIFEEEGEEGFRRRETHALKGILAKDHQIVSGGGGIVLKSENVKVMKERGVVVCLTAKPETVFARVGQDENRPNLNGRRSVLGIAELMEKRLEAYTAAADLVVETDDKSVEAIGKEIQERLRNHHE